MKQRPGSLSLLLAFSLLCLFTSSARADLESDLKRLVNDKTLAKAGVGVKVVRLGATPADATVLFEHNGDRPLIPASNMKLLSTAAALDRLGGDFKFRTLLVKRGDDLVLVGDGDPAFGDAELLKKSRWTSTTVFQNWAEQLKKAGLTKFNHVLVDDSVFEEVFFHPGWQVRSEQARYQAQVGGVSLNANCIDVTVRSAGAGQKVAYALSPNTRYVTVENSCVGGGRNAAYLTRRHGTNELILRGTCPSAIETGVTIHDPPMYAATVFAETLAGAGIQIGGKVGRDRTVRAKILTPKPEAGVMLLAIHETPIWQVINRANKDSVNLYAESLCKRLGNAETGESGSWKNGPAAVGRYLQTIGADPKQFKLDDGSGLSRDNAVSVSTLMTVLTHHYYGPHREPWIASMAVAGEDGTLDNRFNNDLKGRVHAKTGYIDNVRALSGYLHAKNGQWYAFAILMNGTPLHGNSKALQEAIVKAIDTNSGK